MLSPPSVAASHWLNDAIGPYTDGVSCHGASTQRITGSYSCLMMLAGVMS